MSSQSPDFTALAVVVFLTVAVTAVVMVAGVAAFVATHRPERRARRQDLRSYYGNLLLAR